MISYHVSNLACPEIYVSPAILSQKCITITITITMAPTYETLAYMYMYPYVLLPFMLKPDRALYQ